MKLYFMPSLLIAVVSICVVVVISCNTVSKGPYSGYTMQLYYTPFTIGVVFQISCDIVKRYENVKHIEINDPKYIERIIYLTDSLGLESRNTTDGIDARVCIEIYNSDGDIVRDISIGTGNEMIIDGIEYDIHKSILEEILKHLPEDYL